jgi:hypothetical protein
MVIAHRPETRGEGTFSLAFELPIVVFPLPKSGQDPNLALQRAGQKPILNYPDWTRSKCLITNPASP